MIAKLPAPDPLQRRAPSITLLRSESPRPLRRGAGSAVSGHGAGSPASPHLVGGAAHQRSACAVTGCLPVVGEGSLGGHGGTGGGSAPRPRRVLKRADRPVPADGQQVGSDSTGFTSVAGKP